ncbi:hypothetical protein [Nocardiopsis lambiniae]|uniref:DUF4175 domain-containing protein n=1 Tax=Nocardiopsis lambiniae TaxID=3075539 RepID=A0ABU2M4Z0_9ACTN|nr:hypothetical protein [Nocardiopsis sp. DSM 44743]MDT0327654.1 hypothetical protein [Nocardiopsis sp. DSM 44743]
MYGLIWRILPGPWISKFIMALGLLVGTAALLWFFAFPAISPYMPFNDGAIDVGGAGGGAGAEGSTDSGEAPATSDAPEETETTE